MRVQNETNLPRRAALSSWLERIPIERNLSLPA